MTVSKTIDLELTRAEVEVLELEARLRVVPMNDTQLSDALKTALAAKTDRLAKLRTLHATAADPVFGTAAAAGGAPRPARPWSLPGLNGVAAGAVIMGVAYRIWEAHLPSDVLRVEAILIGVGAVLAVAAVAVRSSRHSTR